MNKKIIYRTIDIIAIILWIIALIMIVLSIINNNFWSLTPIFTHNHPQGVLGWDIFLALILSIIRSLTRTNHKN